MEPIPSASPPRIDVRRGVGYALAAGVLLGATVPYAKRALAPPMPPLFAAAWLYVASGVVFLPFLLVRPPSLGRRLTPRDRRFVVAAALIGCIAAPVAYVLGLARLPSHVVALLVNLEAVFGVLVAVVCFGERLGRRRMIGTAALIGCAVLTAALATRGGGEVGGGAPLLGVVWIALACLAWAFDTNLMAPVSTRDPRTIVVVHNLVGGSIAWIASGSMGTWWPAVDGATLALGAAVGIVGYGFALYLILRALEILGAARTNAIFLVTSAVTAVVASALVGGESIPPWIFGSLALIFFGVRLVAAAEPAAAARDERAEPGAQA